MQAIDPALDTFCFDHDGMFLVPAEHLLDRKISDAFAARLVDKGLATPAWIAAFDAALALAHARARVLFVGAPETSPPARVNNVCVVTDPTRVRPYVEPFRGMSWLVYASDFAAGSDEAENVAFGAFAFTLAEQISATRAPAQAFVNAAAHLIVAPNEEIAAFERAARTTPRPDAYAFRKLADGLATVRAIFHEPLRRPVIATGTRLVRLEGTRYSLFEGDVPRFMDIAAAFDEGVRRAERTFSNRAQQKERGRPSDVVTSWLAEARPRLRVVDAKGDTLWSPDEATKTGAVRAALRDATAAGAASIKADLEVVAARTERFVATVVDFDALPPSDSDLDQGNGIYLVAGANVLAYATAQPGFDAAREPAPPFHRWLVGARAAHEWAHLAEDNHLVRIPAGAQVAFTDARAALDEAFARIVGRSELTLELARQEMGLGGRAAHDVGCALGELSLKRTGDYLANLLARHYLPPHEMEAYVRVNVRSYRKAGLGPFVQLARHVYELQYLDLSFARTSAPDPRAYFMATTHFGELFVAPDLVSEDAFFDLSAKLAAVYAHFEIDRAAIRVPEP